MNTLVVRRTAIAAALAAGLAGCSLAPHYERPALDVPAHWQAEAPWRAAQPADDAPKGPWWQRFNDPQLNQWMAQALRENQSLKVAVSNLEQAQALTRVARASLLPQVLPGQRRRGGRSGCSHTSDSGRWIADCTDHGSDKPGEPAARD